MLNLKTLSAGLIIAGTFSATLPSHAATRIGDQVTTRVKVIDLQTERGLLKVYDQLKRTADQECRVNQAISVGERRRAKLCAEDLLDDFVKDIGNMKLTRIHTTSTT